MLFVVEKKAQSLYKKTEHKAFTAMSSCTLQKSYIYTSYSTSATCFQEQSFHFSTLCTLNTFKYCFGSADIH